MRDGPGGVGGVEVGADLVAEALGDGGAAHGHLDLVAHPGRLEGLHCVLHGEHGGGEQRAHHHEVGLGRLDRVHEPLGLHVGAEIQHLEAAALEHQADQVLADIVQIPLHGPDDHLAAGLAALGGQEGPQDGDAGLHGPGGDQHLGDVELVAGELRPHDVHGGDQPLVQDLLGIRPPVQGLLGPLLYLGHLPADHGGLQGFVVGHGILSLIVYVCPCLYPGGSKLGLSRATLTASV